MVFGFDVSGFVHLERGSDQAAETADAPGNEIQIWPEQGAQIARVALTDSA